MALGVPGTLEAIIASEIAKRIPGSKVSIEGNYVKVFIPDHVILEMVRNTLREPYRSATEIERAEGGYVLKLKIR